MAKTPQFAKAPPVAVWATECVNRSPKFKRHNNIGHMKNAVTGRVTMYSKSTSSNNPPPMLESCINFIEAYELIDGEWVHRPEYSFNESTHEYYLKSTYNTYNAHGDDQLRYYWVLKRKEEENV